ncbi:thiazole biosynthesis protein ThiJ [Clostridia bacterium]|nr:thiazole biosynthesis protein ThiJ [Clostridia bacterium]
MIYVFFAHGFEEIEAVTPVDILRRAELEVQTVGIGAKTITGSHGITIHCDISDKEASPKNLEMIVLPGGLPGTLNLEKSKIVQSFIDHVVENDIWLGAICAAPSILGHKGVLKGKKVTCFPGYEDELEGAEVTGERVVRDGKLITGKGAGASKEFALKLVECLLGRERADKLGASMQ